MTNEEQPDSPYQPPLRRRDSAWRYGLTIAIGAYMLLSVAPWIKTSWLILDVALGAVSLALVLFRRRWPTTIAVLTNAAAVASYSAAGPAMLATVSVATRRRWRAIIPVAVTFLLASFLQGYLPIWDDDIEITDSPTGTLRDLVLTLSFLVAVVGMQIGWGLYIGSRRQLERTLNQRANRLEREQEMRAQHARDAERAQIAREMHDVLAHRISQVSMQAGAIAYRGDLDADALRQAASELQTSANAALVDLRGVLGVLRDPESGVALDVPQPRFSDIDTLIAHARSSGLRIASSFEIEDDADVDDTIGRTLYRVTQECLTNARKHAPNATITIRIVGSPASGILFQCSNPLPIGQAVHPMPTSGFGLIGLAERSALVGGSLSTSDSHGIFSITCRLPWEPDTETTRSAEARAPSQLERYTR